ncbi:hypothetical protein BX600DRAFT_492674 [Xylariales sp. PMI_506]|nr:hypothetical protein BX600DRAFT_492674 [Xylariales sp. PMI_506]
MESTVRAGSDGSGLVPAPYGKSCAACSRVKCKCFYRSDGLSCERCFRLGKECQQSAGVRSKALVQSRKSSAKRQQKQKQQRRAGSRDHAPEHAAPLDSAPVLTPATTASSRSDTLTPSSKHDLFYDSKTGFAGIAPLIAGLSSAETSTELIAEVARFPISEADAQAMLQTFRSSYLPFCPFVAIPEHITAIALRAKWPFLWLVIMSITSKSLRQQFDLSMAVRRLVAEELIVKNQPTFDILLGMICSLTWCHFHKREKPHIVTWIQLAIGTCFELAIHQPPSESVLTIPSTKAGQRTNEERRALVGLFIVSSTLWTVHGKTEFLRWSSYLDECARLLAKGEETEADIILAFQARCHLIMNELMQATTEWKDWSLDDTDTSPPPIYVVTILCQRLHSLHMDLPVELRSNAFIQLHLHGTECYLRHPLLHAQRNPAQGSSPNLKRLETLHVTLAAVERFVANFNGLPAPTWPGITFELFTRFTHSMVMLSMLSRLDGVEPGWSGRDEVERRVGPGRVMDLFLERVDQVGANHYDDGDNGGELRARSIYPRAARALRSLMRVLFPDGPATLKPGGERNPTTTTATATAIAATAATTAVDGAAGAQRLLPLPPSGEATTEVAARYPYWTDAGLGGDVSIPMDDFFMDFTQDPWLLDIFEPLWDR